MVAGARYLECCEPRAVGTCRSRRLPVDKLSKSTGRLLIVLAFLMIASACTKPMVVTAVQPDGSLEILGPGPHFARAFEDGWWIVSGDIGPGSLIVTEKSGQRALLIPPGDDEFTILRPVDAILLSSPFLSWSWLLEPGASENQDISVLVGFISPMGTVVAPSFDSLPEAADETLANRALEIRWAASALMRGDLTIPTQENKDLPQYLVRGGRENTGRWWRESIDLSYLYTRLWPGEDPAKARIVFIAIHAGPDRVDTPAYIADMRLYR